MKRLSILSALLLLAQAAIGWTDFPLDEKTWYAVPSGVSSQLLNEAVIRAGLSSTALEIEQTTEVDAGFSNNVVVVGSNTYTNVYAVTTNVVTTNSTILTEAWLTSIQGKIANMAPKWIAINELDSGDYDAYLALTNSSGSRPTRLPRENLANIFYTNQIGAIETKTTNGWGHITGAAGTAWTADKVPDGGLVMLFESTWTSNGWATNVLSGYWRGNVLGGSITDITLFPFVDYVTNPTGTNLPAPSSWSITLPVTNDDWGWIDSTLIITNTKGVLDLANRTETSPPEDSEVVSVSGSTPAACTKRWVYINEFNIDHDGVNTGDVVRCYWMGPFSTYGSSLGRFRAWHLNELYYSLLPLKQTWQTATITSNTANSGHYGWYGHGFTDDFPSDPWNSWCGRSVRTNDVIAHWPSMYASSGAKFTDYSWVSDAHGGKYLVITDSNYRPGLEYRVNYTWNINATWNAANLDGSSATGSCGRLGRRRLREDMANYSYSETEYGYTYSASASWPSNGPITLTSVGSTLKRITPTAPPYTNKNFRRAHAPYMNIAGGTNNPLYADAVTLTVTIDSIGPLCGANIYNGGITYVHDPASASNYVATMNSSKDLYLRVQYFTIGTHTNFYWDSTDVVNPSIGLTGAVASASTQLFLADSYESGLGAVTSTTYNSAIDEIPVSQSDFTADIWIRGWRIISGEWAESWDDL